MIFGDESIVLAFCGGVLAFLLVGIFSDTITLEGINQKRIKPLLIFCAVVFVAGFFGGAVDAVNKHNGALADARFLREATRDLKQEGLRISYLDIYDRTVVLLVGRANCQTPTFDLARLPGRHDPTIRWRPAISDGKQVGLDATDLRSWATACSKPAS